MDSQISTSADDIQILDGREYYANSKVAYILPKDTDRESNK